MKASDEHRTTLPEGISPGALLTDRLVVVRRIGAGGMGEVYEVQHKFTKHRRAAKVLRAQHRGNAEVVERFLREASAAGRIGNPHIVETFDAGLLPDGSPYIVMEFLEGKPLNEVLRWNGRLAPALACALVIQVCEAVHAAHQADIIHRDLKPENLFLTEREGRAFVKVLDFGISKFLAYEGAELRLTSSGLTMGTPLYMSPEQLRGARNADARSDVYSLGGILYEMVAGTTAFNAESFAELSVKVFTSDARPLVEVAPALPAGLSDLVQRAMERDPANRIQTAQAFAEALAPFARTGSVTALLGLDAVAAQGAAADTLPSSSPRWSGLPGIPLSPSDDPLQGTALRAVRPERSKWPFVGAALAFSLGLGLWWLGGKGEPPDASTPPAVLEAPVATPVALPVAAPQLQPEAVVVAEPATIPVRKTKAPARLALGLVNINCTPVACSLDIDGAPAGETPKLDLKLKEGEHEVHFKNLETGAVVKRRFEVKAGEKTTVGQRW